MEPHTRFESFELLLKFGKSSFLRIPDQSPGQAKESSLFKTFWIPAYAGMTKWGCFSKLSFCLPAGPARKVPAGREALLSVGIILQYS
jgi:hypothetical protein